MDKFEQYSDSLTSPFTDGFDVTPSDEDDLPQVTRAIYLDADGPIRVQYEGGYITTYASLVKGVHHPIRVKKIFATGTTNTSIKALY